jgi:hypothetical protein
MVVQSFLLFSFFSFFFIEKFYNGWKNMNHPLSEIRHCKNRRYSRENTQKYQIGRDNSKIGGPSTKIGGPLLDFFLYLFFSQFLYISHLIFLVRSGDAMPSLVRSVVLGWCMVRATDGT